MRPHYSREVDERICVNRDRDSRGRFKPGRSRGRRRRVSGYRRDGIRVRSYLRAREDGLLENPMSYGEIATVSGMTALGWVITDMLDRYIGTEPSSFTPNAGDVQVPNAASVLGMPSWGRILTQAGVGIVGFGFGGYMSRGGRGGLGAAALNGIGLGATVHLIGQLFNALMARAAGSANAATVNTSGFLARLYSGEISAQSTQFTSQAQAAAGTPAGNAVPGFAAVPGLAGLLGQPAPTGYGYPGLGQAAGFGYPGLGQTVVYNPVTQGTYAPAGTGLQVPAPPAGTVPGVPPAGSVPGRSGGGDCCPDQNSTSGDCGCLGMTPFEVMPD